MADTSSEIPNVSKTQSPGPLRIGLSVSNSPEDELAARGLTREHLDDMFLLSGSSRFHRPAS
jgi:hypothetical protein